MRRLIIGLALAVMMALGTIAPVAARESVSICHIPPGNPENAHVIVISVDALPAHLAHGDFISTTCNG